MFWDATVKAYLPVEQVKIPYRIFVGGIAFNTTKEELKEFFSRYGAVRDSKIIRDAEGLSKGYGFVTFFREEDAKKVMSMGTIFFKEKRLNISEAYRKQSPVHATANQQANVYMTVAAPSTWPATSPASSIYASDQGPQMPTAQLAAPGNWPSVQTPGPFYQVAWQPQPTETVYWVPAQYFYY